MYSLELARESKWQMYSFHIDQEINALWSEDYRVTHRVYCMNAYYQKLWKTMKHSERTFISAMILWGTKEYSFSSWNWTHKVSATQGCLWLKVKSRFDIHSKTQWIPNCTRKNHTHTHTKWWYNVRYLVSKFLNSIYWLYFIELGKHHSSTHSLTVDVSPAVQFPEFTVHFSVFFPTYL
jgi:hypothetical protein